MIRVTVTAELKDKQKEGDNKWKVTISGESRLVTLQRISWIKDYPDPVHKDSIHFAALGAINSANLSEISEITLKFETHEPTQSKRQDKGASS